jgi:hypothetical protein
MIKSQGTVDFSTLPSINHKSDIDHTAIAMKAAKLEKGKADYYEFEDNKSATNFRSAMHYALERNGISCKIAKRENTVYIIKY